MLKRKIFRLGPVVLIPFLALWAIVSFRSHSGEDLSWYYTYPAYGFVLLTAVWHVALIARETPRLFYLMYGIIHLPVFSIWSFMALVYATRSPL